MHAHNAHTAYIASGMWVVLAHAVCFVSACSLSHFLSTHSLAVAFGVSTIPNMLLQV